HTASARSRQPFLGALHDHFALMLSNSRQHMDREPGRLRHIATDELDVPIHQGRNEPDIAGEPIELGNDQLGPVLFTSRKRAGELRPIVAPAALDLDELAQQLPAATVEIVLHRLALRRDAVPSDALLVGRDPQIRDKFPTHGTLLYYTLPNVNV